MFTGQDLTNMLLRKLIVVCLKPIIMKHFVLFAIAKLCKEKRRCVDPV